MLDSFFSFSFLFFENPPESFLFSLDFYSIQTQSSFRGIKLIPPGLHFLTLSSPCKPNQESPPPFCHSFIFNISEGDPICATLSFNSSSEEWHMDYNYTASKLLLERMPMFDPYLGTYKNGITYPLLSSAITSHTLHRCLKNQNCTSKDTSFTNFSLPSICSSIYSISIEKKLHRDAKVLDEPQCNFISFPPVSLRNSNYLSNKSPSEVTSLSMDPYDFIEYLLRTTFLSGIS